MTNEQTQVDETVNFKRRTLLQCAVAGAAVSLTPTVFAGALSSELQESLTGKLVCYSGSPVKTLILKNSSTEVIAIDQISQGAFMFDGSIVDCQTACQSQPISIRPNQEIEIQFDKRLQVTQQYKADEFRRVQSRVTRRSDGTREIPFSATVKDGIATIV